MEKSKLALLHGLFEHCTVKLDGTHDRRGARIVCGQCNKITEVSVNPMRRSGHDDQEVQERNIAVKFIKLNWQVGNTASQHRCPDCHAKRKKKQELLEMNEKVVAIKPEALQSSTALQTTMADKTTLRPMGREERYLIYKTIDDHYINESVGYETGWDDARIAKDLGVPRAHVAQIREETFGPNVDEQTSTALAEAKSLLSQMQDLAAAAQPLIAQYAELMPRLLAVEKTLAEITKRK